MHSYRSKGMQNIWEIHSFGACRSMRESIRINSRPISSNRFSWRLKVTRSMSLSDLTQCPITQICVAQHRSVLHNTDLCCTTRIWVAQHRSVLYNTDLSCATQKYCVTSALHANVASTNVVRPHVALVHHIRDLPVRHAFPFVKRHAKHMGNT